MNYTQIMTVITTMLFLTITAHATLQPTTTTPEPPFTITPGPPITLHLNTTGTVFAQQLLWTANTTGTNYEESAVAVKDGIAYIGSCATHGAGHDKLFAVNTTTGDILWSQPTGPGYVGPAIDADTVYLGTCTHGQYPNNEHLYAYNRYTGQNLWTIPVYGGIAESIHIDDTNLYFATGFNNCQIMAINKNTGGTTWSYPTDASVAPNKPMLSNHTLYVALWGGSAAGRLYKMDTTTGQPIWTVILAAGPWDNSITTDGDGRLFLAIYYASTMNAYRDSDGGLIWSRPLHGGPLSFNAYHNGHVFIADTSGTVYCFNAADGAPIWETKIGGDCDISSPTLSGGLLFIGTRDAANGAYYALNETTGGIIWRYPIGASVTCPPSIVGGTMYCGSDGWNMYAFAFGAGSGDWVRHRYDSWNTAYSPVGLTEWQRLTATCTPSGGMLYCTVNNQYDHPLYNTKLCITYPAYWYYQDGTLIAENATNITLSTLTAKELLHLIITTTPYEPPFTIMFTRPVNGLYLGDKKIMNLSKPVAIGHLTCEIIVMTGQTKVKIDQVQFYLDGSSMFSTNAEPYKWDWHRFSFGSHLVKAVAKGGNVTASAEIKVWKFF